MTFNQLIDFVQSYMPKKMQHVYLPLLIGKLVDADGSATLRQLAESVLAQDESQVLYYEKRLKEKPLGILNQHYITYHSGSFSSMAT